MSTIYDSIIPCAECNELGNWIEITNSTFCERCFNELCRPQLTNLVHMGDSVSEKGDEKQTQDFCKAKNKNSIHLEVKTLTDSKISELHFKFSQHGIVFCTTHVPVEAANAILKLIREYQTENTTLKEELSDEYYGMVKSELYKLLNDDHPNRPGLNMVSCIATRINNLKVRLQMMENKQRNLLTAIKEHENRWYELSVDDQQQIAPTAIIELFNIILLNLQHGLVGKFGDATSLSS